MKKRNRFLALTLAAALSLSLGACGGSASGSADAEDAGSSAVEEDASAAGQAEEEASDVSGAEDVLAAAQEKLAGLTSLDAQMEMEMNMELTAGDETQTMESVTTMDMTTFTDPFRMKVDMTMDMGDQGSVVTSIYADTDEDGNCTMYMYDGSSWQSQAVPVEALEEYDATSGMNLYLDDSYDYEEAGMEQINGSDAYKYTTVISGDEVKETMLSTGALDSVSQYGLTSSDLESMTNDLGEIPVSLWIDAESYYPVKYELDMTEVMDTMMSRIPDTLASTGMETGDMSMNVPKMTMSMTCFNFNEATEFEIPEEAKAD